jgi:hypothetical protein
LLRHELQRNGPADAWVKSFVNGPHPSLAQLLDDLVLADHLLPYRRFGIYDDGRAQIGLSD